MAPAAELGHLFYPQTQTEDTRPPSYASTDSSHYKYIKRPTINSVPGNKVELDWSRRNPFNASSLSISNFPAATLQSGGGGRPVDVSTKFCGSQYSEKALFGVKTQSIYLKLRYLSTEIFIDRW